MLPRVSSLRHRRNATRALIALLVVAGATACGSHVSSDAIAPHSSVAAGGDPSRLVDTWTVTSPAGSAGDIVVIGDRVDGGLEVFLKCGLMFGEWRANGHGLFAASEDGGDGSCFVKPSDDPWPAWLDAVGFAYDGDDALLLSAAGDVLARMKQGGHPTTGPNDSPEFASPPAVTDDMRADFAEPAALPTGVKPATAADIHGRWVPVDHSPAKAYVEFKSGNSYVGSDGCNGAGGRYALGDDGVIIATSGGSTLVGCDNSPLPQWPAEAGRVGLRNGHLIFVDPSGKELGEAIRS